MLASLVGISNLLSAVFTGGLLVVALVAARFTYVQLKTQARNAKLERVYALSDRSTDPAFTAALLDAQRLFSMGPDAGKQLWRAPDSPNLQSNVLAVLNFLEEMASEYRHDLLDQAVADRSVAALAAASWKEAKWFVLWIRDIADEPDGWAEIQALADERHNPTPKPLPRWKRSTDL